MKIGPTGRGAVVAFVVGAVFIVVGGVSDALQATLAEPSLVIVGLACATLLGGLLGTRVSRADWPVALAIAVAYGVAVPVLTAMVFALPVAPFAAAVSLIAVPITVPAALTWLVLVRSPLVRQRADQAPIAGVLAGLAVVLLVIRFTQPMSSVSASGASCVSFPGERIDAMSLSPDGLWLGIASARGDGSESVIRVVDRGSGQTFELASDFAIETLAGIAVGPGGRVTYLVDRMVEPDIYEWGLWSASPSQAPQLLTELPAAALANLTYTDEGIIGNLWVDPITWRPADRIVKVTPGLPVAEVLQDVDDPFILSHPALAPVATGQAGDRIVVSTPTGVRIIAIKPGEATTMTVSPDGAWLVYQDYLPAADGGDPPGALVARSTETGAVVVLATEEATWYGQVASGVTAYGLGPSTSDSRACSQDIILQ